MNTQNDIVKLIDIRPTQSGFVADVLLRGGILPVSLPATYQDWLIHNSLMDIQRTTSGNDYITVRWHVSICRTAQSHINLSGTSQIDPRTPAQVELDELAADWHNTIESIRL